MKNYISICLIFFSLISYSQGKKDNNLFVVDSISHSKFVEGFITDLKSKKINDIIYLSDYNFASNDTYVIWKLNGKLKSRFLSNKKIKKKMKNRKLRLSKNQNEKLSLLFNNSDGYDFLNKYVDCESILSHFYYFSISINEKQRVINSKCIPELKENELISPLLELID